MVRKNQTLICAPLMADTPDQLVELMHKAKAKGADIVEFRLDHLKTFNPRYDVPNLIKHCPLPSLFTYRPVWEGGQYDGDEISRFEVLRLAIESGANHIDIELKAAHEFNNFMAGNKPERCKVIVSSHNYDFTPSAEDLGDLVARIQAAGADIVKFATTALDITDVARVFQITVHCQVPIISMVMGERGLISRILCPKFGGYLTFGTLDVGKVSAPGQPTIEQLVDLYNFRLIDHDTKVFGIIGKPVGHSKSPKLYNRAFKADGFNGVYVHLMVDDVPNFFRTYSSPDFCGYSLQRVKLPPMDCKGSALNIDFYHCSCTIPHKEVALTCCDEVDPIAKKIGAVNCVVRKPDGKLVGCNTDYIGAISSIENSLQGSQRGSGLASPLAGKLFVVIGAGGAGRAIAYGAKEKGARIAIANRTYDRARELAELVGGQALTLSNLNNFHPEAGMILANTTSIGMQPKVEETPISKEVLRYYELVFDAVYTPKMTRFLREAEEMGAKIMTGVEMLIGQAFAQYENFTGLPAPKQLFKETMEE